MKWRGEALSDDCRMALQRLSRTKSLRHFYLAGGTALALRLGHRISVDLDFFSVRNPLTGPARAALLEEISKAAPVRVDEQIDRTLHLRLAGTHVSFFHYTAPLLARCERREGVQIASTTDIGAMKLSALVGRGSRKDFLDLYVLTTRVIPLKNLLQKAQAKFRDSTDFTAQALRALVYFKDAESEDPPTLLQPISWNDVMTHFRKAVRAIGRTFM